MKSFKEVLAGSKRQVFEARQADYKNQKIALLEAIKRDMMITCELKNLPKDRQQQVVNQLLEYWKPNKGINKAGIAFLEKGLMAINEESSRANIKHFAVKEIKGHINEFANAFAMSRGKEIVERLQSNIEVRTNKKIKFKPLFELALAMVNEKIKLDNEI